MVHRPFPLLLQLLLQLTRETCDAQGDRPCQQKVNNVYLLLVDTTQHHEKVSLGVEGTVRNVFEETFGMKPIRHLRIDK